MWVCVGGGRGEQGGAGSGEPASQQFVRARALPSSLRTHTRAHACAPHQVTHIAHAHARACARAWGEGLRRLISSVRQAAWTWERISSRHSSRSYADMRVLCRRSIWERILLYFFSMDWRMACSCVRGGGGGGSGRGKGAG